MQAHGISRARNSENEQIRDSKPFQDSNETCTARGERLHWSDLKSSLEAWTAFRTYLMEVWGGYEERRAQEFQHQRLAPGRKTKEANAEHGDATKRPTQQSMPFYQPTPNWYQARSGGYQPLGDMPRYQPQPDKLFPQPSPNTIEMEQREPE